MGSTCHIAHAIWASVEFCRFAWQTPHWKVATPHCVVSWQKLCWCRNCVRYRCIVAWRLHVRTSVRKTLGYSATEKQKRTGNCERVVNKVDLGWVEWSLVVLLAGNHENKEPSKDTDSNLIFPKLCASNSNDIGDKASAEHCVEHDQARLFDQALGLMLPSPPLVDPQRPDWDSSLRELPIRHMESAPTRHLDTYSNGCFGTCARTWKLAVSHTFEYRPRMDSSINGAECDTWTLKFQQPYLKTNRGLEPWIFRQQFRLKANSHAGLFNPAMRQGIMLNWTAWRAARP